VFLLKKRKDKRVNFDSIKKSLKKFNINLAEKSVKLKHKISGFLEKAKISEHSEDEDEFKELSEDILKDLQADLADLTKDIKDDIKTHKKNQIEINSSEQIAWEKLSAEKLIKDVEFEQEIIPSPNEYWIQQFSKVFNHYFNKSNSKEDILKYFNHFNVLKIPILSRLFKKIEETRFQKDSIILFKTIYDL